ncbi:MAG: ABC transporter substrate-binding protein [Planctomycetota bacterium]|jgi:peptide/nickel transport system substrate-binding protein
MNRRGGVATYLIFLQVSIILVLQVHSTFRLVSLCASFDRIEQSVGGISVRPPAGSTGASWTPDAHQERAGDRGDWLIWAFRVEPRTLNPMCAEADAYTRWITMANIFEALLSCDYDTGEVKGCLAERFEVSADGRRMSFLLRENIHFSDGVPLTADDVVFTYETIIESQAGWSSTVTGDVEIDRVVKINQRLVEFFFKRGVFNRAGDLSFAWAVGICPRHVYASSSTAELIQGISEPVGSGPYVFEKWDVGRVIVLYRNEAYWSSKPKLEKIVYRFISNAAASVQALRAHEVDIIIPEPAQFADLVGEERFNREFQCLSYQTPRTPFYYIGWNQDCEFFKDKRVRQAMTHIIDREQIVLRLLKGYGRVITGPFYFDGPYSAPDIAPWPCDLGRAGQLLDQAGWIDTDGDGLRDKDGMAFRLEFMYSTGYALYEKLARLLIACMRSVGIELVSEPCEWSILFARVNERRFDAYVAGCSADMHPDPYKLWHSSQIGANGRNYVGFRSKEGDQIMEAIRSSIYQAERIRLCHRLGRILHQEQPYTFLFTRPTFRILDRRFKNVNIYSLGLNYLEWYVPKQEQRYK